LEEFLDWKPASVRFVDQVDEDFLMQYQRWLEDTRKQHPKTVTNKLLTVCFMLKHAGVENPSRMVEWPTIEEEPAEPYTSEDLNKLFARMHAGEHEDTLAFEFFLATACREREVAHATWRDIDWKTGEYTVCAKSWEDAEGNAKQFTPKKHESRRVPLTDALLDALKARKAASKSAWIFANQDGQPEGHFLRSFKAIARKAGLNCGRCTCTIHGQEVKNACALPTGECHEHYLHRLRKSRATYWHQELHIDLRTIQAWLGHKSLETTQRYLGIQSTTKLRKELNLPMYHVA
jgi:integrase/recombinase XerD